MSIREEVTTLQGELKRLSTLVVSLVASQNQPQFQQGPEHQHQQQPRQQAPRRQFDPIPMTYAELLPIMLQVNLVKTRAPPRCLMCCRFRINLTSHVPSIKEHPAMTSSNVSLWRLKSKADWSQYLAFLRMNSDGQIWSTAGLHYLVLWHIEWIAAIGSLLMFLLLLIFSNNSFVSCLLLFKIPFVPPETKANLCRAFCFKYFHHCHTPILDLRYHWHVSFDPTFIHNLTWSIYDVSVKIRQRGILKYLMFDSESGPLLSICIFFSPYFHLLIN